MKKILLTIINTVVLICGVYSQDTLSNSVYQKINEIRVQNNLKELTIDENLELASAQHGCWLGLYNVFIDTNQIVLTSYEDSTRVIVKRFAKPKERILNFTNREFNNSEEHLNFYYDEPTSTEVVDFMKDKVLYQNYQKHQ